MTTTRPRRQFGYRTWQADEARSTVPSDGTLFKYRLLWPNGRDAGRAAYAAGIGPGDIILNYRGQWLHVLAYTPIDDEDSPYDGVLKVDPA